MFSLDFIRWYHSLNTLGLNVVTNYICVCVGGCLLKSFPIFLLNFWSFGYFIYNIYSWYNIYSIVGYRQMSKEWETVCDWLLNLLIPFLHINFHAVKHIHPLFQSYALLCHLENFLPTPSLENIFAFELLIYPESIFIFMYDIINILFNIPANCSSIFFYKIYVPS